jgi:hypothetical protein
MINSNKTAERQVIRFGRVRLMLAASSGSAGCDGSTANTSDNAARASPISPCSIAAQPAITRLSRSDVKEELNGASIDRPDRCHPKSKVEV